MHPSDRGLVARERRRLAALLCPRIEIVRNHLGRGGLRYAAGAPARQVNRLKVGPKRAERVRRGCGLERGDEGFVDSEPWDYFLRIAGAERATVEMLEGLPNSPTFDHADTIFECLTTRKPRLLTHLLEACLTILKWLEFRGGSLEDFAFPSRTDHAAHISTRRYASFVDEWVTGIGLSGEDYGTHSLRRTKASIIYKATGNLRAVQILLGHMKIESTVRYRGVDVEDALTLAEGTETEAIWLLATARSQTLPGGGASAPVNDLQRTFFRCRPQSATLEMGPSVSSSGRCNDRWRKKAKQVLRCRPQAFRSAFRGNVFIRALGCSWLGAQLWQDFVLPEWPRLPLMRT